jgi:cytochrome c biogenesis protein
MKDRQGGFLAFFSSVRLAIVLLAAIAAGSVLGTVIPQQEAAADLSARLSPSLLAVMQALQLFNVYHSAWFILLLLLLAANLIVCSLKRFPAALRQIRSGLSPERPELFKELPPERAATSGRPPAETADRLEALLRRRYGKVMRAETPGGGTFLACERGGFSRLGVYGVHLGILLMLAGGIAGAVFGVKGSVEIAEGESSNHLQLQGGSHQILDFSIRCDRFTVEYYEGGAPKLFRSDLTFLKDGQVLKQGALLVNHPLSEGGLRFYQASYGTLPGGRVTLSWTKGGQKAGGRDVAVGDRFPLPGDPAQVEVLRVEGNLMQMGPAVKLSVVSAGRELQFWVFTNIERIKEANPGLLSQVPMMNPGLYSPYLFSIETGGERFFTVLQAVRDPGTPIVAAGGGLLIVGLMVVFFLSHRRFWIRVKKSAGGSGIGLAGTSNRDDVGLEREMDRLMVEILETEGKA